ncbi:TetR/AcrR family transcriptional regulator [Enterococcus sp. BWR-S5]|uniref:TetR/AcrR family transcriptional regulator n=1 Tax=Enterococcus sp. BWR-S5 TaxID=2787714 RepID=UPI001920F689|nr:TetR/AcrR family transcriptional regulator [Enterococcus sp. BWR-S5]MBL1223998.1 TetR/AcrR family transcriptional regulator [Enterococcus sp. BWR-S5]
MRTVKEHDERKTEILDTAKSLFLSKGYDKTTINDILKAIGIAKGTFYHYFKSKEEVMEAVVMRVIEQDMVIAREIAANTELSALDKIIQYLLAQLPNENDEKSDMIEQFPNVENALMKQRAMEGTLQHICPILAEIIEEGNKKGEFQTPFPLEAIQFLIAGIQTLLDERMMTPDEETMKRRIQSFIDIIFRVIGITEKIDRKMAEAKIMSVFAN